jgi:hypothetical protein
MNRRRDNLQDLIVANYSLVHQDRTVTHQVNLNTKINDKQIFS